jgi:hypothetical protein
MSQNAIGKIGAALADPRVEPPHADRDKMRCNHANRPMNVLHTGEEQVPAFPLFVFAASKSTVFGACFLPASFSLAPAQLCVL